MADGDEAATGAVPAGAGGRAPLDLRRGDDQVADFSAQAVNQFSERWAEVVRPLTIGIFLLLAAVITLPFLLLLTDIEQTKLTAALDWAKTVLAPVVGFASAAVGYYYGTRQSSDGSKGASQSDDEG